MNKVREFSNKVLGEVRTVILDEEVYFVAKDVASILGYKNPAEAIIDHTDPDDRKALKYKAYSKTLLANLWSKNDFMDKILINEPGLWALVFGSKLDSAKEFKKWIYKEVIPSLRENGGYIDGQENLSEEDQEILKKEVQTLKAKVNAANSKIESLKEWNDELEYELEQQKRETRYYCSTFDELERNGRIY